MKNLICLCMGVALLSACASSKNLKPPKNLPANWQVEPNAVDEFSNPQSSYGNPTKLSATSTGERVAHVTSLWSSSPKSLFGDRRANKLGDILTVEIDIDEEAQLQNSVATDYSAEKNLEVSALFGIPELITKVLPAGASMKPAMDVKNSNNLSGQGNISRKEKLTLRLAARVNGVLPNGYLSLIGRQEIIVNDELRYLQVSGIVRIADISRLNTITYDKIADAKIFYGGRGQVTRATEEKTGNRIISKILPF